MRYVKIQSSWLGHSDCDSCELQASALLGPLDAELRAALVHQLDDLRFPRQSVIFHQGAASDALFMLRDGAVKLVRYQTDGTQRIVRLLRPGDVLGLEAVLGGCYDATAMTLGEVRACRIPGAVLAQAMTGNEALTRRVLEKYQWALSEAEAWLGELSAGSAPARVRVARLLLRLRLPCGEEGKLIKVGAADIGDILGITVETASRVIAAFKREGALKDPGRLSPYFHGNLELLRSCAQGHSGRRS